MPATAFEVLRTAATTWPDEAAIVEDEAVLTFRGLEERVLKTARAFVSAGFAHGDRFAIWAPNSINWQVAALAGQAVGCALVPLNTRFRGAEAEDILRRSGARGIFYASDFLGTNYGALVDAMQLQRLAHKIDLGELSAWSTSASAVSIDARTRAVRGEDLADVLYTSGTTGAPKGVMCTHAQNIRVFRAWSSGVTLGRADNYLIVNPYFHSFGYKAGWLAALLTGATAFPMQTFEAEATLALIERAKISFLPGAPTIFSSLLAHKNRREFDTTSLRCAVTGAASVPVQLVKDMKHKLGFKEVYTAYGLTESTGVVSLCRSGDDFETIANTSGRAMQGVEVRIADGQGKALPAGQAGEIWVRGFNVMKGYLDDQDATAAAMTEDGFLKTGDVGVMDERGYLKITDRIKDMYICGGFNCYPAEIEQRLLTHPAITDVAVLGVADARMGEVGHAFVVAAETIPERELIDWASANMANYKVPRRISFVQALPRNASGKVQKFRLREAPTSSEESRGNN